MNLTALHPYLLTKKDATDFILLLDKLFDQIFNDNYNFKKTLSKYVSYDMKKAIEKMILNSSIKTDNKTEMEIFFKKLKEEILSLPIIHIMLAFDPKEDLVKTIHNWFYQNYKKTVLLEISTDESLIGGAVISFGGHANDYSVKNHIEQMI